MAAQIMIRKDGYKRFRNITVQTKVGFQKAFEFRQVWNSYHGDINFGKYWQEFIVLLETYFLKPYSASECFSFRV